MQEVERFIKSLEMFDQMFEKPLYFKEIKRDRPSDDMYKLFINSCVLLITRNETTAVKLQFADEVYENNTTEYIIILCLKACHIYCSYKNIRCIMLEKALKDRGMLFMLKENV